MPNRQALNIPAIERALGVLANTMRRYTEALMQFGQVFDLDREEAINNLDRAFEAKLNAFHSLYDVSGRLFPYFDHGDTAALIAIRNALHHHDNPLFHSFYARLHLEDGLERWEGASFLVASYPARHGDTFAVNHLFRVDDLDARLDPALGSPYLDSFLSVARAQNRFALINRDLGLSAIRAHANAESYPADRVYFDLLGVFTSAVNKVFLALHAAGVAYRGDDAETYGHHFARGVEIDLLAPQFRVVRVG
jgi:hypothetical protein